MNDEKETSRDEIEPKPGSEENENGTENQVQSEEIHPETDNPDELDPRLFSPLQEEGSASPQERLPDTHPPEELEEEPPDKTGEGEELPPGTD